MKENIQKVNSTPLIYEMRGIDCIYNCILLHSNNKNKYIRIKLQIGFMRELIVFVAIYGGGYGNIFIFLIGQLN